MIVAALSAFLVPVGLCVRSANDKGRRRERRREKGEVRPQEVVIRTAAER